MAELSQRRSALEGHNKEGLLNCAGAEEAGVRLKERRGLSIIQFDGRRDDRAFRAAAEKAVGFALPEGTGGSSSNGDRRVLWTGVNRYLLVLPDSGREKAEADLREALQGRHHSILDLGQARTVIRVAGRALRDLLSKGALIDLHPRAFPVGAVAQSQLAHVGATIHHVEEGCFDIYVFRSFALHLWEWLHEAGEEYGILVEAPETQPGN